jgi:predicted DNA binding protein
LIRQVSLEIAAENEFQTVASREGVNISMVDCHSFNSKGMTMLFRVEGGSEDSLKRAVAGLRGLPGTRHVYESRANPNSVMVLAVLDRPQICSACSDAAVICVQCPFSSPKTPSEWRFLVQKKGDLREIISRLERGGVHVKVDEVSEVDHEEPLTGRQREILGTAVRMGYFDFPRGVSLTELSSVVGVKPSTLSEILRSGERKIMEAAAGDQFRPVRQISDSSPFD